MRKKNWGSQNRSVMASIVGLHAALPMRQIINSNSTRFGTGEGYCRALDRSPRQHPIANEVTCRSVRSGRLLLRFGELLRSRSRISATRPGHLSQIRWRRCRAPWEGLSTLGLPLHLNSPAYSTRPAQGPSDRHSFLPFNNLVQGTGGGQGSQGVVSLFEKHPKRGCARLHGFTD